jgi:hypothetical protein
MRCNIKLQHSSAIGEAKRNYKSGEKGRLIAARKFTFQLSAKRHNNGVCWLVSEHQRRRKEFVQKNVAV